MNEKKNSGSKGSPATDISDCPVCLQQVLQPVKLPCGHIFCFLCAKGILQHNNKCALCRKTIPKKYLKNPQFVQQETRASDISYKWFYKGQSGWWQYDDRTNSEIEAAYQNHHQQCEVCIAGNLYIIDLTNNMQMQKHNSQCRRHIKRDLETVHKKGVGGVYFDSMSVSDNCKPSCSGNDNSCKSTASEKMNRNSDCIIIIPSKGTSSGVHLNLDKNGLSLSTNSTTSFSSHNHRQLTDPENLMINPTSTAENSSSPVIEELLVPSTSCNVTTSHRNCSRNATASKNVVYDFDISSESKDRKRKRVTDILEITEKVVCELYATTILSKLQEMNKKQRLFSEMLINDALFKGLLGKLTENSCISESI